MISPPTVDAVVAHSAAEEAGIKPGDLIVSIDGSTIDSYEQIPQIVSISAGQPLPIVLNRHGRLLTVIATPRDTETTDPFHNKIRIGMLGISHTASRTS